MCQFFSLISDGRGNVKYFDAKLRAKIITGDIKDKAGNHYENADSHSSIASYYRWPEDLSNKWEYNPITKVFTKDQVNTVDDGKMAEEFCHSLDFKTIVPQLIIHPIVHPLKVKPHKVTPKDIANLKKWDSVRASVRDSVGTSVRDSVWASVGASVWDSVWDSVRDSAGAYTSSFFDLPQWKHIDHPTGINPYQPLIDLWNRGFVPSFDGKTWRLHQGKDAKIVYEWIKEA